MQKAVRMSVMRVGSKIGAPKSNWPLVEGVMMKNNVTYTHRQLDQMDHTVN